MKLAISDSVRINKVRLRELFDNAVSPKGEKLKFTKLNDALVKMDWRDGLNFSNSGYGLDAMKKHFSLRDRLKSANVVTIFLYADFFYVKVRDIILEDKGLTPEELETQIIQLCKDSIRRYKGKVEQYKNASPKHKDFTSPKINTSFSVPKEAKKVEKNDLIKVFDLFKENRIRIFRLNAKSFLLQVDNSEISFEEMIAEIRRETTQGKWPSFGLTSKRGEISTETLKTIYKGSRDGKTIELSIDVFFGICRAFSVPPSILINKDDSNFTDITNIENSILT